MLVQNKKYDSIYKAFVYVEELRIGISKLLIINCQFVSNIYANQLLHFNSTRSGTLQPSNCHFKDNKTKRNIEIQ